MGQSGFPVPFTTYALTVRFLVIPKIILYRIFGGTLYFSTIPPKIFGIIFLLLEVMIRGLFSDKV